jgi:hypothetical protein
MSAHTARFGPARSRRAGSALAALMVLACTGCSPTPAGPAEPPPTVASVSDSPSETSSPSPSPSPTPSGTDTATPSGSPSPTPIGTPSGATPLPSASSGDPSATGAPPVLDRTAAGRDLRIADFFAAPVEWRDGTYDVASERALPGVSGPLRRCNEDEANAQTFELRLANNFTKISMRVGQTNNSENSDAEVLVRVIGNGAFIDSTRVKFNKVQNVSVPVAQVNALKLEVYMTGKKCDEDKVVNAVIANLRLE